MRAKTRESECSFADIFAALAEVALGKPWAAFDRVMAEAHENLPPDVRARLVAYPFEEAAKKKAGAGVPH